MDMATNKDVLERFDALLSTHDLDQLAMLCTPDLINHALAPGRPAGLAGTREFLQTMGRRQFADAAWDELNLVAEGDYVAQFGVRSGRWLGGEFMGLEAPAGHFARDFAALYRFHEGRIAERWVVRDDLGMLRQLGALPQP